MSVKDKIKRLIGFTDEPFGNIPSVVIDQKAVRNESLDYFADKVLDNYYWILKANLTDNSYNIMKPYDRPNVKAVLSTWLDHLPAEEMIHPDDVQLTRKYTNLEYIKDFFLRHGDTKSHWILYRKNVSQDYIWTVFEVTTAENYSEENQCVYISIRKADDVFSRRGEHSYSEMKPGRKILIINDDPSSREALSSILLDEYDVFEAENGETGIRLLEKHWEDIEAVFTALDMPVCGGKEFLERTQRFEKYRTIPVVVTLPRDAIDQGLDSLKMGASDFIAMPFRPDVVKFRLNRLIRLTESTTLLNVLETDKLTGLYSSEFFYQKVKEILKDNPDENYRIICSDIENFHMVNEKYGTAIGDKVLAYFARQCRLNIPNYVVGGRIAGDIFAALYIDSPISGLSNLEKNIRDGAPVSGIVLKYGSAAVDRDLPPQTICDHARAAIEKIKGKYGIPYAEYNEELRREMIMEQQIVENMESAVSEHQFQIYYQPKYSIFYEKTGGAEALVRWIHPDYGFLSPSSFIPVFEKNGFIKNLDLYVWESVCGDIARWKSEGLPMVPISVNLSRRDFEDHELAHKLIDIAEAYNVEPKYLHIEVTESAFIDNPDYIANTIKTLHDYGFKVELDDFGAGYSSLEVLNSMDIDILKLDVSIIREDVPGTDRNILEFCMQLAKIMKFRTVAEGVESKEQVARLKSLGCDFIQGYYYSKPLPAIQFEEYLKENS